MTTGISVLALFSFIQVYGADYELISKWGSFGSGNGLFNQPAGIAVSPLDDDFYVADSLNNRIQKFFADGPFITKWGTVGLGNGQINQPQGVVVDLSGMVVYVVDTGNNRIQKFDSNGTFISSWGSPGSANGLFKQPIGIAADPSGKFVYVADTGNNRIQKFDSNGNFIAKWGKSGSSDGQFKKPIGIAIDPSSGQILIVDSLNNRIQKFDSNGNFIAKWGSTGSANGQFKNPYGIAADSKGRIYVSDKKNNNIQLFSSVQNIVRPYIAPPQQSTRSESSPSIPSNITFSDLPQALTLTDDSGSDNFLSLRAMIANGEVKDFDSEGDFEFDNFELNDWNPPVTFQFSEGSPLGLVNVQSVLIGQVKSYNSAADVLKVANYWKQIPLNEQVVLPLDHKGTNFMIAQVEFKNGIVAIYSGTFDVDAFGTKSFGQRSLKLDIKEGVDFKVKRDVKFKPDYSDIYWQLAQSLACRELDGHGFPACS